MDNRLEDRLKKWSQQIDVLEEIESKLLPLEASEESLEGKLYLQAPDVKVDERWAHAHTTQDWIDFKSGVAELKVRHNKEARVLKLREKAFEAEYLTLKKEADIIQRGRGGQL